MNSSITAVWGSVFLATGALVSFQDGKSGQGGAPTREPMNPKIVTVPSSQARGLALQRGELFVGTDLFDPTGARLGKIDDLVFDAKGNISHVILQGEVGGQPRLFAIPWGTLSFPATPQPGMETPTGKVTTNFSSTRLETAPNFAAGEWPKEGQDTVFTESDAFFQSGNESGRTPVMPANASMPVSTRFRASRIRNMSVMDDSGKPLGSLGQFVIDSNTGRITYATMTVNTPNGDGPRVIAVPWETFTASRQNDRDQLRLGFAMDRLATAPEFQAGTQGWKQMSDPTWVSNMYGYYSARPYWVTTPKSGDTSSPPGKPTTPDKPTTPPEKGKPSRP